MFVSDLVTEIFAVTLLGISGLDEINYNVLPFLYAVNIYIDTNYMPYCIHTSSTFCLENSLYGFLFIDGRKLKMTGLQICIQPEA